VHDLFQAQARRSPNATALEFEGQTLTYRDLNSRANQLAHYLRKRGAGPDSLVALCMDRSLDMVVGLIGILKSGAAYIPLDPPYPEERWKFVISDARPILILTQQSLKDRFVDHPGVIALDVDCDITAQESGDDPHTIADPRKLAYVIYTSGSTGKPKGVEIEHRSVVNFLTPLLQKPGISGNDVLVAVTTIAFDIAALEIYLPLI